MTSGLVAALLVPSLLVGPRCPPSGVVSPRMGAKPSFLDILDGKTPTAAPPPEPEPEPEPAPAATIEEAAAPDVPRFSLLTSPQPAFDSQTSTHAALDEALNASTSAGESLLQSVLAGWADEESRAATVEQLAELEKGHVGAAMDSELVKEALIGCWKLMVTTEADGVLSSGVSGLAASNYTRVAGHFQTFRKPDPLDVLTGNTIFMETNEVIIDVKEGSSSIGTVSGGFSVDTPGGGSDAHDVLEFYSQRATDGKLEALELKNRWSCVFISADWRICKLGDGSLRTYAKVDPSAAKGEISRLKALDVAVDPAAVAAYEAATATSAPPPPPVDTRPKWQRETEDGGRFVRNGGNFGPITG